MIKLILKIIHFLFFVILLLLQNFCWGQYNIPKKPSFIPAIVDSTQTLTSNELLNLSNKLIKYSDSTSTEIFIMVINTTYGQEIGRYATELGEKWEIGQKGKDNGIVILVAKQDRKTTIQTGYGTEHLLTDALSRRIIDTEINPYFKNGEFSKGLNNGLDIIFNVLQGEYKGTKKSNDSIIPLLIFLGIIILFFILASKNRNNNNNNGGSGRFSGPDLTDIIILSSMGRSSGGFGGGFGSSGSGGFGGFGGGGSFGGGGATGSW